MAYIIRFITREWYNALHNYKNNSCYYRQLAAKTTTYYYHFDHLGSVSLADFLIDKLTILKKLLGYHSTNGVGVCHADEIFYLFKYVLVAGKQCW